jgi:putative transposase
MARPLRIQYEGAIYHVTVRGNGRQGIFIDDRDRERFLERLSDAVEVHGVRLYLYCLMSNHVHLMVETPSGNLSRFMHQVQTAYVAYFNRRHDRTGHLTQGRYGARVVRGEAYVLALSRYVHLNPVFVAEARKLPLERRIEILRGYPWSSYRSYVGLTEPLDFMDYAPILALTGASKPQWRRSYRKFVEAGIAETDSGLHRVLTESPLAIGAEAFRRWVGELHRGRPEDVSLGREAQRVPIERVLEIVCGELGVEREALSKRRRNSLHRPIAARMLCKYGRLTQRQAADVLNLGSSAAVSLQIKRLTQAMPADRKLRKRIGRIEQSLERGI